MNDIGQVKAAQAAAVARTMRQISQLPELKSQLAELEAVVGDYGRRVPAHGGLGTFLQELTTLMDKHDLSEQDIKPGGQVGAENLNCTPVSIHCKGRLTQIFGFLSSLQSSDRLVRIEEIRLSNDSDFGGDVGMQAQVVIFSRPRTEQG
ncbi:MAG: type 4a pilus biogenesis protein PilO [Planctomycetota bacterium]